MFPPFRAPRLFSCLLCLGIVGALVGCTLGPNFVAPKPPADTSYRTDNTATLGAGAKDKSQRLVSGQALREDWWTLFRSSELDATVQAAIAGNRTLVQARATLAQAQQAEIQAAGGQYPQLNVAAGADRQRLDFATLGIPAGPGFPRFREFNVFTVGRKSATRSTSGAARND